MHQDASLKNHALIAITLASFLTPFTGSAINLAIPSIGEEFNSSAILLSAVVSSYLASTAAFLLAFGRLADLSG
ncbi:MAG: MFS transporter, partial [Desulfotomaculaceae bacterium]|nr:MFS transporter [Desulfotomaculaceae bacterium]